MIGKTYRQLKRSRARQESLQCATGAHPVARKECGMRSLCPYKIVASIVCRPDHQVVRGKRLERVLENGTWQMRAVAVEGDDALPILCEVRKHRSQACRKTLTLLFHHARSVSRQTRQFAAIRLRAHHGNLCAAQ